MCWMAIINWRNWQFGFWWSYWDDFGWGEWCITSFCIGPLILRIGLPLI
jgi:hypothetical protein